MSPGVTLLIIIDKGQCPCAFKLREKRAAGTRGYVPAIGFWEDGHGTDRVGLEQLCQCYRFRDFTGPMRHDVPDGEQGIGVGEAPAQSVDPQPPNRRLTEGSS